MPSYDIFKFVSLRAPREPSEDRKVWGFTRGPEDTPLRREVVERGSREEAEAAARAYLESDRYDPDAGALVEVAEEAAASSTVAEARRIVESRLDRSVGEVLERTGELRTRLWDSIYAQSLVPEARPEDRDRLYRTARALHLLDRLEGAGADDPLPGPDPLGGVVITIPDDLAPAAEGEASSGARDDFVERVNARLTSLRDRLRALDEAAADIESADRVFRARALRTRPVLVESPSSPDDRPRSAEVLEHRGPVIFDRVQPRRRDPTEPRGERRRPPEDEAEPGVSTATTVFTVPAAEPWLDTSFAEEALKASTRELLDDESLDLREASPEMVLDRVEEEKLSLARSVLDTLSAGALRAADPEILKQVGEFVALPYVPTQRGTPVGLPPAAGSPAARGIRPLGIGDLLVVKQELLRYTPGEVAHVENVMQAETRSRIHVRERETEQVVVVETEEVEESERDLQTTERFELQREAEETIESEMTRSAGASVSASYGAVTATARADFGVSKSLSEARRSASSFAREVTDRSVARILQRVREERSRRTLERVRERNEHGFDNRDGDGHVIGVYRWVDKHYRARIVNYGRRLMLEFVLPEPAAFYLHARAEAGSEGVTRRRPRPPTVSGRPLRPHDLNRVNYDDFVAEYDVQDVEPPPARTVKVSAATAQSVNPTENAVVGATVDKLEVPPGYRCVSTYGETVVQGIGGSGYFIHVLVGGEMWGPVSGYGLEGNIPISISGWATAYNVSVVAECRLKAEAWRAWQLETFAAIMAAYENARMSWEEEVAAAEIDAGVVIGGRSPAMNREVEREELRRGALRMLTDDFARTRVGGAWRFHETFDAMRDGGELGYPEFDVEEALTEGRIIQFFETAFEWENLTYRFYPYFWARKERWPESFGHLDDPDPQFAQFLRAGAARVVVPAHPSYAEAVLHYMRTNEIWNGGEPPTVDDPLFVSIADELRSAGTSAATGEDLPDCAETPGHPCIVDEWEVVLPTSLVHLQEDASLPDFTG